ncbi:hypothetical protein GRF61_13210 [Azoarcus sp. TTM-91]|uniref:hypothetical protein n=1 Tax=Azoarcus sp. TTM-91 TaxID=2691581 RepID=UPI00145E1993|nr:hypothetical protein [Azoarcus sp. TTM-91]NMG35404.1 hypothetical protein [Azoarcus sp. TTM-91]
MSTSENADSLGAMSNLFAAIDLLWSATIDKLSGLEIGTTATTSYGAVAAGLGIAEQYAIWESSDKELSDLERFSVGLGSNLPGFLGFIFVPKKLFDENFDQGENEAENPAKLIRPSTQSLPSFPSRKKEAPSSKIRHEKIHYQHSNYNDHLNFYSCDTFQYRLAFRIKHPCIFHRHIASPHYRRSPHRLIALRLN